MSRKQMKWSFIVLTLCLGIVISCSLNKGYTPKDTDTLNIESFIASVAEQKAIDESAKAIIATFNADGHMTLESSGIVYTDIEMVNELTAVYKSNSTEIIVALIDTDGNVTGDTDGTVKGAVIGEEGSASIDTKFLNVIVGEKLAAISDTTMIRTDTGGDYGSFNSSGEVMKLSSMFGWKAGLPLDYIEYLVSTEELKYYYQDPSNPGTTINARLTVDPETLLGTLYEAGSTRTIRFDPKP